MSISSIVVVIEWKKREAIGVLEVSLATCEREEDERADDEHQAHEHLQSQDLHSALLPESEKVAIPMVVRELTGMNTAQRSGDMTPAYARATATVL